MALVIFNLRFILAQKGTINFINHVEIPGKEITMSYPQEAKAYTNEKVIPERAPEIHSLIQEVHGNIDELGDVLNNLDSQLSCISSASSPTASVQPPNKPTDSPIGNELSSISCRISSLIGHVRDIRNRLCV